MHRITRTNDELDDMAIADAITTFLSVTQRDWVRRQRNRVLPYVMEQVDQARSLGHAPDVKKIMEDAFLGNSIPLPELTSE